MWTSLRGLKASRFGMQQMSLHLHQWKRSSRFQSLPRYVLASVRASPCGCTFPRLGVPSSLHLQRQRSVHLVDLVVDPQQSCFSSPLVTATMRSS